MTSPDKLALASRAEQAGGPDRELDREIAVVCGHAQWRDFAGDRKFFLYHLCEAGSTYDLYDPPPYTASLDAITALIAEKLPDHWGVIFGEALRTLSTRHRWHCNFSRQEQTADLPLALCAAFLRALALTEDRT